MTEATQLRARPEHRFTYAGRALLVTSTSGAVTGAGAEGLYFHNTRVLSRLRFGCDGQVVDAFAFSPVRRDAALCYLELPQSKEALREEIEQEVSALYAEAALFLGDGLRVQLRARSYAPRETPLALQLHLGADFRATAEASAGKQKLHAPVKSHWDAERREVVFRYEHDQLDRSVAVRVEQGGDAVAWDDQAGLLTIDVTLPARDQRVVDVAVSPIFDGHRFTPPPPTFRPATRLARLRAELGEGMPRLETTNTTVARAWESAVADLASLPLGIEPGPASPIAGAPLYDQIFGRDILTTGWQALLATPRLLRDALLLTAARQARHIDDWRDAEPGKMLHQAGDAPTSAVGADPFSDYYGDYATAIDFLAMLGQYYLWTADLATARTLLPPARRAITWAERYGDLDGDGLLEYVKRSPKGVKNQGWKDARNAIVDEHGRNVDNPIATCELQAYWYAGLRNVAAVFFAAKDRLYAAELLRAAERLRRRVEQRLWLDDEQTYALGLGPDKQPLRSVTSNAGHLLVTGVASPQRGRLVARRLLRADMFSGWGIRTLSADHPAYNPFSYHLGSVWPVEQATIAAGFGRYGCVAELHTLTRAFFDSTELFDENRLPESIGGLARETERPHPGIYPRANEPQAWSASAVVLMIQALLGLRPAAPLRLLVVDPQLPEWLPELRLRDVAVGHAVVDLHARRERSGRTSLSVARKRGSVRVVRQPGLRQQDATLGRRARALLSA